MKKSARSIIVIALALVTIASILGTIDIWACTVAPNLLSKLNTSDPPPLVEPTFSLVSASNPEDISTTLAQITENPVGGRVASCVSKVTNQQRILYLAGVLSILTTIIWLVGIIIFLMVRKLKWRHEG